MSLARSSAEARTAARQGEGRPAPTAARTVLAVDLGTQSLRVSALDTTGRRLWSWSAPVDSRVDGEVFEQSPAQWAALLDTALAEAARAGIRPDAIAAAGPLAGYIALDAQGRPLTPAAMYSDRRSAPDVAAVEQALATAPPGLPRVYVADPLPHWLRIAREQPAIAAQTRHFLDATGWLVFHLTGRATLNPYTALRLYTPEVQRALRAGEVPFGEVAAIGSTVGPLAAVQAQRTGWGAVPVIAATFDSKCAYLGSGIDAPGDAADISGTVTSFGVVAAQRIDDARQRIYSVPFGDRWLVRGSTATAGGALEWARVQLLQSDFGAIDAAAASVPPGARGLTFLPYLAGERAPLWNPHARGALLGLALDSTQADIARAVYEGLAFGLAHIAQAMRACGVGIGEVRLAGGLARNDLLAQIKADVLGVPAVRLADHELTTLGLAVIASVALGAHADHAQASRCFVATERRFVPDPRAVAAYAEPLRRFIACSDALLPTFWRAEAPAEGAA